MNGGTGRRALETVAALFTLAACALPAAAQRLGAVGASYELYTFQDAAAVGAEQVTLATIPLVGRFGIGRVVSIDLVGNYAAARLVRPDGSEVSIAGPTDTDVRVNLALADGLLTLTGVAVLPTGHVTHTGAEAEVAGVIAADLLPFRISNWGSGGGARVQAALAVPVGEFAIGMSAGYGLAREFEPLSGDQRAYLPGNELALRFAVDRTIAGSSKFSVLLGVHRFGDDALDGRNLYRSGNRYQALGSYAFPAGRTSNGVVYAGVLRRERGTVLVEDGADDHTAAQELILLGTGFRLRAGRTTTLIPSLDARVFRSDDGVGQGYTLGAGMSAEVPAGSVSLVPLLRLRVGRVVVQDDVESGLRGIEAAVTVRFGTADQLR
jgi:hypothetical protein